MRYCFRVNALQQWQKCCWSYFSHHQFLPHPSPSDTSITAIIQYVIWSPVSCPHITSLSQDTYTRNDMPVAATPVTLYYAKLSPPPLITFKLHPHFWKQFTLFTTVTKHNESTTVTKRNDSTSVAQHNESKSLQPNIYHHACCIMTYVTKHADSSPFEFLWL